MIDMKDAITESSISGIVPNDTPLISEAFTERSIIAVHGMYILVKVKRLGKWFKLKALSGQFAVWYDRDEMIGSGVIWESPIV